MSALVGRWSSFVSAGLFAALSLGCSSSSNGPGKDGAAGADGGHLPDGAATDALDAAATDALDAAADGSLDGLLSDISRDVVATDSADSISLTSGMLTAGAAFLSTNTCAGANTSPALTWSAGPAGTMSYAITLTDLSIDAVHWVIWDIPAGTTSLAAALPDDTTLTTPAGAKQVHKLSFFGAGGAYRGPCPRGPEHVYQFEVNAIGSATLAGVGAAPTTEGVKAAVQAASLAHGDLDGTSNATPPATDAAGQ